MTAPRLHHCGQKGGCRMPLIPIIVTVLLLTLLVIAIKWLFDECGLPRKIQIIVLAIIALLVLVWVLAQFGLLTEPVLVRR